MIDDFSLLVGLLFLLAPTYSYFSTFLLFLSLFGGIMNLNLKLSEHVLVQKFCR